LNVFSPIIIKSHILNKFRGRAFNVHNGKLPQYAGIHVHQWAIRNGETKLHVTIHHMTSNIDAGNIVAEHEIEISDKDTGLSLFHKSIKEGIVLMENLTNLLIRKSPLPNTKQNLNERTLYKHKDALDSRIDWNLKAKDLHNFIRAGSYYPLKSPTYTATLFTKNYGKILILKSSIENASGIPGELLNVNNFGPLIACGENSLRLTKVKFDRKVNIDWNKIISNLLV
tara:strand:+ start:7891 stop:8571 length:681 start_codon:yes stop_codon:yes gene_type:complete